MTASDVSVLVIDDDGGHADAVGEALTTFGYQASIAYSGEEGLARMQETDFDVVLTDLKMSGVDGMEILEASRRKSETAVVLITGYGSVENAVDAMRAGAVDYITKPVNIAELKEVLERILENQHLRRRNTELEVQLDERYGFDKIIGQSQSLQKVFQVVRQVAPTDVTVLIAGESGTGKELIAQAIHQNSKRRNGPFVALTCAALPESLLESELFGYTKGAFTGATADKAGHIESAEGGTLFLDELGEMSLQAQVRLLRVLEQREVVRVGTSTPIPVDIRIVAATNKNLEEEVVQGRFRQDLYFRLRVVAVELPPLQQRLEDVPLLVESFVNELAEQHGVPLKGVSTEVVGALQAHDWPGNVRELRNVIEYMVVTTSNATLELEDLPEPLRIEAGVPSSPLSSTLEMAGRTVREVEREHIRQTLALMEGNRAKAADMMGIGERTLYRKIREYGLT